VIQPTVIQFYFVLLAAVHRTIPPYLVDGLEDLLQIRLYGLQFVQVLETLVYRLVVKTAWSKS